jgi:hypothetical protein
MVQVWTDFPQSLSQLSLQIGMPVVGLIIPTRWEAEFILRYFNFKRIDRGVYRAVISGHTAFACISGMGRPAAARGSVRLVKEGAQELVSVGFCGALIEKLEVGDLVTDRLLTVDIPASTPEQRRTLAESTNAIAVDMETRAIIETGTRLGVPIRILRVVSDELTDDLTPLLGTNPKFSMWRVALRLLNPRMWPLARTLRRQSTEARERLVEELEKYFKTSEIG